MGTKGGSKSTSKPVVTNAPLDAAAAAVGKKPFVAYTGPRVAGASQTESDAIAMIKANAAGEPWKPGTDAAAASLAAAAGPSSRIDVSGILQKIAGLSNPFEDTVVNNTMSDMRRQTDIAQRDQRLRSAGSSSAIRNLFMESELERDAIDRMGKTAGDLRSGNFTNALNAALGIEQSNQNADLADKDRLSTVGAQQGSLAALIAGLKGEDARTLYDIGREETARAQMGVDADYSEFLRGQGWDAQQLAAWAQASAAARGTETTSKTSNGIGGLLQGVGAIGMGMGALQK